MGGGAGDALARDEVLAAADGLAVYCQAHSSYQIEQERGMKGDYVIMQVAMILMIGYVAATLGRFDAVRSRALLALSIVATVALALGVAFGLGGLLGWPFTQLSMMCIFVILGVGVDDMFIVVDAFERARERGARRGARRDGDAPPGTAALAAALEEIGASILLTSTTDLLAFGVGAAIDLPAIRYFCLTCAVAVAVVFV